MTPEQYTTKWPNHCTFCGGWGFVSWVEHHDGHNLPGEPMTEYCDACVGNGSCPRCGAGIDTENTDEVVCNFCDWHEGDEGINEPDPEEPEEDPYDISP